MVQTAVADIVSPAVTTDDPHGAAHEEVGHGGELLAGGAIAGGGSGLDLGHALTLGLDVLVGLLGGHGGDRVLQKLLELSGRALGGDDALGKFLGELLLLVAGDHHAEAELSVILEEGVRPCGALALGRLAVGGGGEVAAVDGGAARGIGDAEVIAADLGEHLDVRGLAATRAGAGELKERALELGGLGRQRHTGELSLGQTEEELPVLLAGLAERVLIVVHHGEGLAGLGKLGADLGAETATGAVLNGDLQGELLALERRLAVGGLEAFGGAGERGFIHDLGADGGMRADRGALEALDAGLVVPVGDVHRDVALLILRGGGGPGAVVGDRRNGQLITLLTHHLGRHILDELRRAGGHGGGLDELAAGGGRHGDLLNGALGGVDGVPVQLHHIVALLAVGLLGGGLEEVDGLLGGDDAGDHEEGGLHDGVGATTEAEGLGDLHGVHHVELQLLLDDDFGDLIGDVIPHGLGVILGLEQEGGAHLGGGEHVILLKEGEVVARHEVGLGAEVGAVDGVGPEAQVGDGEAARLLGVIDEVALRVVVGVRADDLDAVLVRANGAVGAQTVEHALGAAGILEQEGGNGDGGTGHVVIDAHGEVVLGGGGLHVVEDALDHGGGELLGAQAVTAAVGLGIGDLKPAVLHGIADGGAHVGVEGLANGAGLLGAVEHGELLHALGERGGEGLDVEGAIEAHLDHADLLALRDELFDDFLDGLAAGAHDHDHVLGVRGANIVEEVVLAAGELGQLVHVLLNDGGDGLVVLVDGLAALEVNVRVLGGAAHGRRLGVEAAGAEGVDGILVNHLADDFLGDLLDLLHFVGGAEAVEEVHKRHLRLKGGGMRHERHVAAFLDAGRAEEGKARLAAGHDVAVVAENGKALHRQRARRHMEDGRREFARDLVHVRDHQQEALRGREGGGERPGGQRTVHGTRGAAFGLQLDDLRDGPPDVGLLAGGPFVGEFSHRRRRGDGIDGGDFGASERDTGGRFVAVAHDVLGHVISLLREQSGTAAPDVSDAAAKRI